MFSIVIDRRLQLAIKGYKRKYGMGTTLMIDPNTDIPIDIIQRSLRKQIEFYDSVGQRW